LPGRIAAGRSIAPTVDEGTRLKSATIELA